MTIEHPILLNYDKTNPITLAGDDEFADRFFLLIGSRGRPTVRLTIAGADLADFAKALSIAKEDLDEEV